MQPEKKSKLDISLIDNPDFSNLSFSKFFSSLVEKNYNHLIQVHQHWNPSTFLKKYKQNYTQNSLLQNSTDLVKLVIFGVIYSFLPGWVLFGCVKIIFSTIFWEFTNTKIQVLINNQRLSIRTSRINRSLNFIKVLSLLPFIIGFSFFFKKKYPAQLTSYFFEKNIPGLSFPTEKLNWDTVQYLLKPRLQQDNFEITNLQGFSAENSLILNENIFDDSLGQKIFIQNFQKRPFFLKKGKTLETQTHRENFTLASIFPQYSNFQNLDDLPVYLESFIDLSAFSGTQTDLNLLNIQRLQVLSKQPQENQSKSSNRPSILNAQRKKPVPGLSKNILSQKSVLAKPPQGDTFLGITIQQKKVGNFFQNNGLNHNLEKLLVTNEFLIKQKEFQNLWEVFQYEIHSLFSNKDLILDSLKTEKRGSPEIPIRGGIQIEKFSKKHPKVDKNLKLFQTLKDFLVLEEKTLLEEILLYLAEVEIIDNPFQTRLMSGYKYPDMTSQEITQLYLQQKLTPRNGSTFLQIKIPSTLIETCTYDFHGASLPEFSILVKPVVLKDFEKDKILYEGPGILFGENTAFDWKTSVEPNLFGVKQKEGNTRQVWDHFNSLTSSKLNKFELKKHQKDPLVVFETLSYSKKTNLRLWFQRYLSAYTPFAILTKNFFGLHESPEFVNRSFIKDESNLSGSVLFKENSKNNSNFQTFPLYKLQKHPSFGTIETITNLNQSIFQVNPELQLPFLSPEDWKKYYQLLKGNLTNGDLQISDHNFLTLPLIQTRFPKVSSTLTQNNSQISLYDNFDYAFNTNMLTSGSSTSYSLNTNKNFQGVLENENFETIFDAGFYNKLPSIFSSLGNPEIVFQDNWEPLSFQSWLIICQIGFAYLVFQILKALADNYGRELLVYLLDLVAMLGVVDDEIKQQIEILLGNREKGFRVISKSRKNFSNIAGVKKLLPELAEIVWFLRNSAREFSLSKTLPRGILLIGPPGTGKTLLVQALAGEANVPVLALSGSSLVEPGESGALKLENLFQEARRLAPCIVFIDEMDTLAQKREQVMQHPMGEDGILELLTNPLNSADTVTQFGKFQKLAGSFLNQTNLSQSQGSTDPFSFSNPASQLETQVTIQAQAQQQLQKEQLRLLMQLLVELDGIQGRDGVIVIGATNRPETLDAAVLRPGRFDRILELGLPGYQKRIDILKLYSQKLGYEKSISWNYFAERTDGFTAADLASIMNVSSLKAILSNTAHTLESIEHGLDRIMTSESQKASTPFLNKKGSTTLKSLLEAKDEFITPTSQRQFQVVPESKISENQRLAYYQAGKIICTSLLPFHPPVLIAQLWNRRTNLRALKIAANLQNYFLRIARRREVEERIIGSYAGKVGEILYLQKRSSFQSELVSNQLFNVNASTLGLDDLSFGQVLVNFLIDKWYLYSTQPILQKLTELPENRNFQELSEEKIAFLDLIGQNFESSPRPVGQFLPEPFEESEDEEKTSPDSQTISFQHTFSIPWWQQQISSQLESVERSFDFPAWYRIYIPNPEETELNPYWLPPDEFYHRNTVQESVLTPKKLESAKNGHDSHSAWNGLGNSREDYKTHSLVLQSFNQAFVLVEKHRELLDAIAAKLLTQKVLRQWDISELFEKHNLEYNSTQGNIASSFPIPGRGMLAKQKIVPPLETKIDRSFLEFPFSKNFSTQKISVHADWGSTSRRKTSKWIDFQSLKP